MTSREHPTATITTPNSTPGQSGRFGSERVAAFVGMRSEWNDVLAMQIMQACAGGLDPAEKDILGKRLRAALAVMKGIEPGDGIEDMAAAQLVAAHHAGDELLPARGAP